MKRILTVIPAIAFLAGSVSAQTMGDAITFGQNHYYGTARTLAMGNAVTAIGGDLGTIAINPAGGAVSAFSQFAFSTGFTTSSSVSSFAASYDSYDESPLYTGSFSENKTRMTVPNIGLNMYFDTGQYHGVKGWNFGFMVNRSQTFTNKISAVGDEGHTSITGAFASAAGDMPGTILADKNMFEAGYGFNSLCAYDAGLINYNSDAGTYYGSAETVTLSGSEYSYEVLGWLRQNIGTTTLGSKNDMVFNYGMNIDDRIFVGVNLNVPLINYKYSEYFAERALDTNDFPVTPEYWKPSASAYVKGADTFYAGSTYKYNYTADISGVNAKLGVIWLPADGIRLGAAFQTPTAYSVHEKWYIDETVSFVDATQSGNSGSDVMESEYNYRSPYSANFGVAYTFGRSGLFSVDYELTDFSIMKFSQAYNEDFYTYDDPFLVVNRLNKLFCGVQHSLRIGAEVKVLPSIALRAGLTYTTNPERHYTDTDGYTVYAADYDRYFNEYEKGTYRLVSGSAKYSTDCTYAISLGAGYSSSGSFYADLALRRTTLPTQLYKPYSNYLGNDVGGVFYEMVSPSVKSAHSLFDAVLTLGWRF